MHEAEFLQGLLQNGHEEAEVVRVHGGEEMVEVLGVGAVCFYTTKIDILSTTFAKSVVKCLKITPNPSSKEVTGLEIVHAGSLVLGPINDRILVSKSTKKYFTINDDFIKILLWEH